MIKNTLEFRAALNSIQRAASQPTPSRARVASMLERLAVDVWAAPRKSPAKGRKKKDVEPRDIVNVGKIEQDGLESLQKYLGYAINDVGHQIKKMDERIADEIADGSSEDEAREFAIKALDITEIIGSLEQGLDQFEFALGKVDEVSGEKDLTKAVGDFSHAVNGTGDWVENIDVLKPALELLGKAKDNIPPAITGPGALRKLQVVFDAIASACSMLGKKKINAPKVPKALDPEDPRQLNLFAAAAHVRTPRDLCAALDRISDMTSQPNPSRQAVAYRLQSLAQAIRG